MTDVLIATETFSTDIGGETFNVHRGNRVPADHPMVARNPHYFRLPDQETDFAIETGREAPGEKRASKPKATETSKQADADKTKTADNSEGEKSKEADDGQGDTGKKAAEQPKAKG